MIDRPTSVELVQAVRQYLEAELLPALTDARQRFQTLVAAHVLGIVERELPREQHLLFEESRQLADILQRPPSSAQAADSLRGEVIAAQAELCERIRTGDYDDPVACQTLLRQLRPMVMRKLEIANPRYLGSGA
jgi:hypothetical protein